MPRAMNGVYTLPNTVNPVISGTTITSIWANTTLVDVAQALTESLDRAGRGSMTAPLKLAAGTVGAPSLSFGAEPTSGLYRAGSGDLRMSVLSTDVFQFEDDKVTSLIDMVVGGSLVVADTVIADPATLDTELVTLGQVNKLEEVGALTLGKVFVTSTGFTVNTGLVNDGIYAIYNDSGSSITITQGAGVTLRLSASTAFGDRIVPPRALLFLWAKNTSEYVLTGAGAM